MVIDKQEVIKFWLSLAIEDFYLAFVLNRWYYHQAFLSVQGLEKICKAYLLGKNAIKYENCETEDQTISKIDEVCRDYGHNFEKMIADIDKKEVENLVNSCYDGYHGKKLLEILKNVHIESRYVVVPHPVHKKFPIKNTDLYNEPMMSTSLSRFSYVLGRKIFEYIQKDFSMNLSKDEVLWLISKKIDSTRKTETSESSENRFCNVFFGDDLLKKISTGEYDGEV